MQGKRRLAIILGKVPGHPEPRPSLEQYSLVSDDAAELIWTAYLNGDVKNKVVLDLGCGTGRLALGCALMGSSYSLGVDLDLESIKSAKSSSIKIGVADCVDFVMADVTSCQIRSDVVVQNPPFGVQRKGADRLFIQRALDSAPVVYSLHKSGPSNRKFIQGMVARFNRSSMIMKTMNIRLPKTLKFHREKFHEVEVDLYRFVSAASA